MNPWMWLCILLGLAAEEREDGLERKIKDQQDKINELQDEVDERKSETDDDSEGY